MKTSLMTLAAVGLLGAGVAIHHSGRCPLMEARAAMLRTHHEMPAAPAVSDAKTAKAVSAVKPDAVVLNAAR